MAACRFRRIACVALLSLFAGLSAQAQQDIQDNSFLIEEAYNQEPGVVQHISTFERSGAGEWVYALTEEWPLRGIRHQLSYTVPFQRVSASSPSIPHTGIGDAAIHYRYQLAGDGDAKLAIAP